MMLSSLGKKKFRRWCIFDEMCYFSIAEETAKSGGKKDEAVKEEAKPVDVK